jgi:sugar phosphate permease
MFTAMYSTQAILPELGYVAGALGAYIPGLAWQSWHWTGVWALVIGAYAVGLTALLTSVARGLHRR